ncbi:MAG TPA: TRAP transporter small permease [Anaerovoracaceae bacterium]|nr:TRAP transporter small permease [Anaerovoracaceae bacterium]
MLKGKSKFIANVNKAEDISLVVMFAIMVSVIFFQVIMRYLFNNSLSWSEELGKFFFVWISWLGISIGQRRNEHIKITLFIDRLSDSGQRICEIITDIILLIICSITIYYAVLLVQSQINVPYAGIKISTSWGYLSLVLGCSFMALRLIEGVYTNINTLLEKRRKKIPEGGNN